jgi:hypothetical protein
MSVRKWLAPAVVGAMLGAVALIAWRAASPDALPRAVRERGESADRRIADQRQSPQAAALAASTDPDAPAPGAPALLRTPVAEAAPDEPARAGATAQHEAAAHATAQRLIAEVMRAEPRLLATNIDLIHLSSPGPLLADLTGDDALDFVDFVEFQNLFVAGDDRADFSGDGALDLRDVIAFQDDMARAARQPGPWRTDIELAVRPTLLTHIADARSTVSFRLDVEVIESLGAIQRAREAGR